jgi:hypothetical protein
VIGALVENASHVPYRECALTRVLKDSLGGNSRTVLIANVRAVREHVDETLQTLRCVACGMPQETGCPRAVGKRVHACISCGTHRQGDADRRC